jgi:Ni/Fe-hydrogenase subunit HybB-like protein
MEINSYQSEIISHHKSHIEKYGTFPLYRTIFYLLWIFAGGYCIYLQIVKGHHITGMRDNVIWGLYIVNFIYIIGLSYAGAIIAGILHLAKVPWGQPIIRMAQLMSVICVIIGPIFILLCIGRLDRLYHLFFYPRLQSPMIWDVVAVMTYLVGCFVFFYLCVIKDYAYLRDANLNIPNWKQKLYKFLSLGYTGTEGQNKSLNLSTNLMAIIMIPLCIIISSILSWIFGMTLRPGWHSTIFGPYFVIGAIYSGVGMIIVLLWIYRRVYKLEKFITEKHFKYLGYMILVLGAGYGYFTFSEYFTNWYASMRWDKQVIDKLFSSGSYGGWTFFSNGCHYSHVSSGHSKIQENQLDCRCIIYYDYRHVGKTVPDYCTHAGNSFTPHTGYQAGIYSLQCYLGGMGADWCWDCRIPAVLPDRIKIHYTGTDC